MRRKLILAAPALLAGVSFAHAQAPSLANVNAEFDAVLSRRDQTALDAMWLHAPHVVAIHPAGRQPLVGWEAVRQSWAATFARFAELSVTLPDPQVHVLGDMGWVVGTETIRGRLTTGAEVNFAAMTTNIYERHAGRWLMVLHQAGRIVA